MKTTLFFVFGLLLPLATLGQLATSQSVTPLTKTTVVGQNLFDATTTIVGEAVAGNGLPFPFGGTYRRSALIPVQAGSTCTLSGLANGGFFTVGFLSTPTTSVSATTPTTFPASMTVPTGTNYVVFTSQLNGGTTSPTIKFEIGNTATPWTPYVKNTLVATAGTALQADLVTPGATMNGIPLVTQDQAGVSADTWPASYSTVLMVGSSITNGLNVADSSKYTTLLTGALTSVYGRSITVINGGTNGASSAFMLSMMPSLLSTYHPQIVFIEATVNDAVATANCPSAATIRSQVVSMVNLVRAAGAVPVIFATLPFAFSKMTGPPIVSQQRRLVMDAVNADVARMMRVRYISCLNISEIGFTQSDGIHPNDDGNRFGIAPRILTGMVSY